MLVSTTDTGPVQRPIDAIGQEAAHVAVVPWPSDTADRWRARALGRPCLLVVDPAVAPPTDCGTHEDWVLTTTPRADVRARLRSLAARPAPSHPVALDPLLVAQLDDRQVRVLGALDLRPGRRTPRRRLAEIVDQDGSGAVDADLADALSSLRRPFDDAGIELVELPGDGDVVLARIPPDQRDGGANRSRAIPAGSRTANPPAIAGGSSEPRSR